MKTPRYLTLLLSVFVLTAGLSAKDFEGMIRFKMTPPDKSAKSSGGDSSIFMNYYVKGGLIRVDMDLNNGKTAGSIIDPVNHQMTMIMADQKMYMVMKMPPPKKTDATAAPSNDAEFTLTGETDTILGYKCQRIIVKSKDGEAEIWGAEGLGMFQSMGGGHGPMGRPAPKSAWEASLAAHGFFPLRMVSHDKSGREQMRMEAVAIDPKSPDDSLFVPPADFQKLEMPSFGGMNPFGKKSD